MGAWDHGMLDDDVAADLAGTWDEYVVRGRAHDPEFWTPERILRFFESSYLARRDLPGRDADVARLAIGALYQRDGIEPPPRLLAELDVAAARELTKERLSLWESPTKRKRALRAFLDSLGRTPPSLPRRAKSDALRTEVKQWEEFSRHYPRWVEISRQPFADQQFFDLVPKWFFDLQQFVGAGLGHDDHDLMLRGKRYRAMHLAWYVGFILKLPDAERLALIDRAERVGADSFIMPSRP